MYQLINVYIKYQFFFISVHEDYKKYWIEYRKNLYCPILSDNSIIKFLFVLNIVIK